MNYKWLTVIVAAGLFVGAAGHQSYDRITFDRAKRIAQVFSDGCLSEKRLSPEDLGLLSYRSAKGEVQWIDTTSKTLLQIKARSCSITAHEKNNLSIEEAKSLAIAVEGFVSRDFPELEFERAESRDSPTFQRFWGHGKRQSPERWGVFLYASLPGSKEGTTILSYSRPNTQPASQ